LRAVARELVGCGGPKRQVKARKQHEDDPACSSRNHPSKVGPRRRNCHMTRNIATAFRVQASSPMLNPLVTEAVR